MKFRIACQDRQAGEFAVKCFSQGRHRMARVGLNRDCVHHYHGAFNHSTTLRIISGLVRLLFLNNIQNGLFVLSNF